MSSCLAVDVGGTKLAAGIVTEEGNLLSHEKVPTPKDTDAEGLFQVLGDLVTKVASRRDDLVACGVGCGGPMSKGGEEVSPLNIPAWVSFPLRSRLESLTGLSVTVDNDAKALALAEGWIGAAKGLRNFMGMVVSTGVGGGIVLDGRLVDGRSGNAGHIGHLIVEPEGRLCRCGARGCLEAEASGNAISEMTGRPPSEASPELVLRTGRLVGLAVASVTSLLDLELTVVAGSIALGFGAPFFAAASSELAARSRIAFTSGARIEPAGLGSAGPLIGAGAVAWRAAESPGAESQSRGSRNLWKHLDVNESPVKPSVKGADGADSADSADGADSANEMLGMLVVSRTVAVRPYLWVAAISQAVRLARPHWWRRWPPIPVPTDALWRMRMVTAYGGEGRALPDPDDVQSYLEWCREAHSWRKR